MKEILVLTNGFVFIGDRVDATPGFVRLTGASCIRKRGTTRGLGQIALSGPTPETVLDPCGEVEAPLHALIFRIPCRAN